MGFKSRPICCIKGCENGSLLYMLNNYFCGPCIAKWDKKQSEEIVKRMQEGLGNDN